MKIEDLKGIAYSASPCDLQEALVWNVNTMEDIAKGTIEYIIDKHGEYKIYGLHAWADTLVITVEI